MEKELKYSENNPYNIFYENYLDTNACTECTGLMYRAPENEKDWNAYRDVFDFTAKPPSPGDSRDHRP